MRPGENSEQARVEQGSLVRNLRQGVFASAPINGFYVVFCDVAKRAWWPIIPAVGALLAGMASTKPVRTAASVVSRFVGSFFKPVPPPSSPSSSEAKREQKTCASKLLSCINLDQKTFLHRIGYTGTIWFPIVGCLADKKWVSTAVAEILTKVGIGVVPLSALLTTENFEPALNVFSLMINVGDIIDAALKLGGSTFVVDPLGVVVMGLLLCIQKYLEDRHHRKLTIEMLVKNELDNYMYERLANHERKELAQELEKRFEEELLKANERIVEEMQDLTATSFCGARILEIIKDIHSLPIKAIGIVGESAFLAVKYLKRPSCCAVEEDNNDNQHALMPHP